MTLLIILLGLSATAFPYAKHLPVWKLTSSDSNTRLLGGIYCLEEMRICQNLLRRLGGEQLRTGYCDKVGRATKWEDNCITIHTLHFEQETNRKWMRERNVRYSVQHLVYQDIKVTYSKTLLEQLTVYSPVYFLGNLLNIIWLISESFLYRHDSIGAFGSCYSLSRGLMDSSDSWTLSEFQLLPLGDSGMLSRSWREIHCNGFTRTVSW